MESTPSDRSACVGVTPCTGSREKIKTAVAAPQVTSRIPERSPLFLSSLARHIIDLTTSPDQPAQARGNTATSPSKPSITPLVTGSGVALRQHMATSTTSLRTPQQSTSSRGAVTSIAYSPTEHITTSMAQSADSRNPQQRPASRPTVNPTSYPGGDRDTTSMTPSHPTFSRNIEQGTGSRLVVTPLASHSPVDPRAGSPTSFTADIPIMPRTADNHPSSSTANEVIGLDASDGETPTPAMGRTCEVEAEAVRRHEIRQGKRPVRPNQASEPSKPTTPTQIPVRSEQVTSPTGRDKPVGSNCAPGRDTKEKDCVRERSQPSIDEFFARGSDPQTPKTDNPRLNPTSPLVVHQSRASSELPSVWRNRKPNNGLILIDDFEEELEEAERGREARARAAVGAPTRSTVDTGCVPAGWKTIDRFEFEGAGGTFKEGKCVELKDGSFLSIDSIIENQNTTEVHLRGWVLVRTNTLKGLIENKLNELIYCLDFIKDNPRNIWDQNMKTIALDQFVKFRGLVRTNARFPEFRFSSEDFAISPDADINKEYAKANLKLVVRWKFIKTYENDYERRMQQEVETMCSHAQKFELTHLSRIECNKSKYINPATLRKTWQNDTTVVPLPKPSKTKSFGSFSIKRKADDYDYVVLDDSEEELIILNTPSKKPRAQVTLACGRFTKVNLLNGNSDDAVWVLESEGQTSYGKFRQVGATSSSQSIKASPSRAKQSGAKTIPVKHIGYTLGDAFCCGGGATRGAQRAGFTVVWGLDMDASAGETWRHNFPDAVHNECSAFDFISGGDDGIRCDVLHLSPPCQPYSPNHTREGKNDDHNVAALYACGDIIDMRRPRFCTLEETFGILFQRFEKTFNSLIKQFTTRGFSVSWRQMKFLEYGLPQKRKRCVIFAAGPGEDLWELPSPTHSATVMGGKLAFVTPRQCLDAVPAYQPHNHDVRAAFGHMTTEWDVDKPIGTICCSGPKLRHHVEPRALTIREMAVLQGFPAEHAFKSRENLLKQIGNAVPPSMAEIWYRALIRHLAVVDGRK